MRRLATHQEITIYALCDPDTDKVRYIGQTVNPTTRLAEHLYNEPAKRNPKTIWVQSLREQGKRPVMTVLEIVTVNDADNCERKWMQHYRDLGYQLTNLK